LEAVVKMVEIACPRCSSSEAEKVGPDVFVCRHCHTRYIVDHGHARLPDGNATPSARRSGSASSVMLGAGLVLLLLGAGAGYFLINTAEPPPEDYRPAIQLPDIAATPPASTKPYSPSISKAEDVEPPPEPSATLDNSVKGETSIGGHYWLSTYRNTGEVPIERPSVIVSLFDKDGARVGEQPGYAGRTYLRPGESTTILALSAKPPTYEHAEVTAAEPSVARYTKPVIDIQVREHVVNPLGNDRSDVVGTVDNTTEGAVDFIKIVVVGRDKDGNPVAFSESYASDKDLGPGESSGFKVTLGTWLIEPPETIEVSAFGSSAS